MRLKQQATLDVTFGEVTLRFAECAGLAATVSHLRSLVYHAAVEAGHVGDDGQVRGQDILIAVGLIEPARQQGVLRCLGEFLDGWDGVEDENGRPAPAGPSAWQAFCSSLMEDVSDLLVAVIAAAFARSVSRGGGGGPDPTATSGASTTE